MTSGLPAWGDDLQLVDRGAGPVTICKAYGPLAAAAPLALMAASTAMTIIGGANQAAAQRQAGEAAYQNALMRNQVAQVQATQLEQNAGQQEAASQRVADDQRRKGLVMASRMKAVMGASGAGEDPNLIASLEGEGNYNADVALFNGSENARGMRNQAALQRWSGAAGVGMGAYDRSAASSAADSTLIGSIGKGVLSFASKYGGALFGGQDDGVTALSPADAMTAYRNAPTSWTRAGLDSLV